MRKILRELRREFPDVEMRTTGSNRYRIILPNGRSVIVSNKPGCQSLMRNVRADVRRQMKEEPR
ncbi:hypothetical protein [Bradyrhizobium lablabi]|uniref:hypothetical protein n=1 Tax=Bradyrhizobium lablabi TaxID=722472 RepID=UPI001BAB2FB9|nr:hypothetical protein [Bradyrhizobium lablabi]MBR0695216.1 hypothetical protein [Bradyrhizobium lablabi]